MYMDLVGLAMFLCVAMPVWVFFVMGWQVWTFDGMVITSMESDQLEFIWTLIPSVVVGLLCLFNIQFLGAIWTPKISACMKVMGRQRYWSYELPGKMAYDSLMCDTLSSVDKPLRMFYTSPANLLVTSSDVIHSFSVPDLGVKVDAVPGRTNQMDLHPDRMGVFSGYCTELCGAGHSFMPVMIEIVKRAELF